MTSRLKLVRFFQPLFIRKTFGTPGIKLPPYTEILKEKVSEYDINANSHAGLKHQFTLHFIKSGLVDKELGRVFVELFDWRQKGDYGDFYDFDEEKTMPLFNPVETLITTIESLIIDKK